jgi:hypothetical protein
VSYDVGPKALIDGSDVSRGMSPNLQHEPRMSVSGSVINGIKNEVSKAERVALCAALRKLRMLTLSHPSSNLVLQYDFSVPLRCRKTFDMVFVAFVRPLSEPVRRFSSYSTDFSQHIAQVELFLFLHVFLF